MSNTDNKLDNLTEFSYGKFCSHYSKRNWFWNEALFTDLPDDDKAWWKEFIIGIRNEFNTKAASDLKEARRITETAK